MKALRFHEKLHKFASSYQSISMQQGDMPRGLDITISSDYLLKVNYNKQWKNDYKWIVISILIVLIFLTAHLKSVILSLWTLFITAIAIMVS